MALSGRNGGSDRETDPDTLLLDGFEEWCAEAYRDELLAPGPEPRVLRSVLGRIFARVRAVGGDYADPTPDLVRIALDAPDEDFELLVSTVGTHLLYLRADGMWRRSERNVQQVFDMQSDMIERRLERTVSFGGELDDAIGAALATPPPESDVLWAVIADRPLVRALGRLIADAAAGATVDAATVAGALGLDADSSLADHWHAAFTRTDAAARWSKWPELPLTRRLAVAEDVLGAALRGLLLDGMDRRTGTEAGLYAAAVSMQLLLPLIAARFGGLSAPELFELTALGIPEASEAERAAVRGEVVRLVSDLTRIGLWTSDADGAVVVEDEVLPFAAAVLTSATAWWPTSTVRTRTAPVVQRSSFPGGTSIRLRLSGAGAVPDELQRVVVLPADASLEALAYAIHGVVKLPPRGVSRFSLVDGTPRYAPRSHLRFFSAPGDEHVTAWEEAQVGALFTEPQAELVYEALRADESWSATVTAVAVAPGDAGGATRPPGEATPPPGEEAASHLTPAQLWAWRRALRDAVSDGDHEQREKR